MWLDHYQAERMMNERVKDALRQATQDRMARVAEQAQEVRRRHLPLHFILGCRVDTSQERWEPMVGREQYRQWRDSLISVGWAEWVNPRKREEGWTLVRPSPEIMQMVFLA